MIDFHSHFLPNMDDGSNCIEESIAMLQESYTQGVDTIVATPHFYAERSSISKFLSKRQERYNSLLAATERLENIPDILLGAEVLYFQGMSRAEMIPSLCIEHTNILLLEMPFIQWDEAVLREIDQLQNRQKLRVVIAHLDRYFQYQKNPFFIKQLLEMPVKIQLNAGAVEKIRKHTVMKLVKEGKVDALGSDCHNMRSRVPNMKSATTVIEKKLGAQYVNRIEQKSLQLLQMGGTTCGKK